MIDRERWGGGPRPAPHRLPEQSLLHIRINIVFDNDNIIYIYIFAHQAGQKTERRRGGRASACPPINNLVPEGETGVWVGGRAGGRACVRMRVRVRVGVSTRVCACFVFLCVRVRACMCACVHVCERASECACVCEKII